MTYLLLFWEFFKTGLFAVGGGLATLPFLREIALKHGWFTVEQLSDMLAVSEATPGPIGINMATYAGFNTAFILGALVATVALVLPSFIILCIVGRFLDKYKGNRLVQGAFHGLRPATAAIVTAAVGEVFITSVANPALIATGVGITGVISFPALILFAVMLTAVIFLGKKIHPVIFIAAGAAAGILLRL